MEAHSFSFFVFFGGGGGGFEKKHLNFNSGDASKGVPVASLQFMRLTLFLLRLI